LFEAQFFWSIFRSIPWYSWILKCFVLGILKGEIDGLCHFHHTDASSCYRTPQLLISDFINFRDNQEWYKNKQYLIERSDSGLLKSWRLGAWHSYWPAMPTLYVKLNFLGIGVVASPWCCQAPVLQEYFFPLSELSNDILYVFVPFLLFQ